MAPNARAVARRLALFSLSAFPMRASLVLRQQHSQAARLGAFQAGRIGQRRSERSACRPQAFLSFFRKKEPRPPPPRTAADDLVEAIEGSQRGLIAEKSAAIEAAVAELERLIGGGGTVRGRES